MFRTIRKISLSLLQTFRKGFSFIKKQRFSILIQIESCPIGFILFSKFFNPVRSLESKEADYLRPILIFKYLNNEFF